MKRIGILGGISAASTLEYYRTLTELYYGRFHDYHYPEIVLESLDFQRFTDYENADPAAYRAYILQGLRRLCQAEADFALLAANSPHSALPDLAPSLPLPVVSIVDAVGQEAKRRGLRRVLLTGIRYTMESPFYPAGLRPYGVEVVVPEAEERRRIDDIIFGELVLGLVRPASRAAFLDIVARHPADGVLLGCTELPQLVTPADTDVPLLDSLRLHCQAALDFALAP